MFATWVWFFPHFYCFWFLHLLARNHKHNALHQRQPTMTMMGHIKLPNKKHGWHRFFIRKHIAFSPMPFVSYKIILGFIELVTGALTKGCTCMHIISLILPEIDRHIFCIYIYLQISLLPPCAQHCLFGWIIPGLKNYIYI